MLTESIKKLIKSHSLKESPRECCGLIVENNNEFEAFPCKNRSENNDYFKLDAFDYLKASCFGKVKGVYHSHLKNPSFSLLDKQQAKVNELKYILYFVPQDEFKIFDPSIDIDNYLGRKFNYGTQDCFTLVKDYFSDLNIKVNNYTYNSDWKEKGQKLFDDNYLNEGFDKVDDLKKNDVILFKFRKDFSEHCAIYLGDGLILHQPREKNSMVDSLDKYKEYVNYIVRYQNLC